MRALLTKNLMATFIFLLVTTGNLAAQQDSATYHWWKPTNITIQHGGSIGYFSGGVGYFLNKKHTSTLNMFYGHIPVSKGGSLHIFTAKFIWRPFTIPITNDIILQPLNPGFFLSYHSGKNFDSKWDDNNYPKGYYWWSTAFRPHIAVSNEIKFNLNQSPFKSIGVYSEFNTNELYLVSYIQNRKTLGLNNIFKLGFGARAYF